MFLLTDIVDAKNVIVVVKYARPISDSDIIYCISQHSRHHVGILASLPLSFTLFDANLLHMSEIGTLMGFNCCIYYILSLAWL